MGELVAERCGTCHQDGGVAPFALTTYDQAATWGAALGAVVEAGTMPPWPPADCGDCGHWQDSRALTDAEKATLLAWVDGGSLQGDEGVDTVEPGTLPTLSRVDATLAMEQAYTPDASLSDDYRCFVVDPGLEADAFLTAFELHPGDDRVVHHAILYTPNSDEAAAEAAELDAADEGYGWTCYGGAGISAEFAAGWVPGIGAVAHPDGTGVRIPARPLVLQIHYNLANGAFPDQTDLDLQLEGSVEAEAEWMSISQHELSLEPGQELVSRSASEEVGGTAQVWGLTPHMHELGSAFQMQVHRNAGETECLIDIPEWDFHWQGTYFYEEPVMLERGDVVEIGCMYDTRSRDTVTDWGDGTTDEMCLVYAYVTEGGR